MPIYDNRKHYAVHKHGLHAVTLLLMLVAAGAGYYIHELHHPVTLDICASRPSAPPNNDQ